MTHICVNKLTIGSDNGLSPGQCQAIIYTNAGILLIGTLGTNFSEILIEIRPFSFKEMHLKMSSGKWRPFCLSPNVLIKEFDVNHSDAETGICHMMTSSNGNIFRITGPVCWEFTGQWWISLTKASDVELCFLWLVPEKAFEKTSEMPVIWDAIVLIMMSL